VPLLTRTLREWLQAITDQYSAEHWPLQLLALQTRIPHSIAPVDDSIDRLANCFAYALGVSNDSEYRRKAQAKCSNVLVNADVVLRLLAAGDMRESSAGEIAVYFEAGNPSHAGVVTGDTITSKWGSGLVFQHAVFEVPSSYGEAVKRFNCPDRRAVLHHVLESTGT
jgi:hypothetical protein